MAVIVDDFALGHLSQHETYRRDFLTPTGKYILWWE